MSYLAAYYWIFIFNILQYLYLHLLKAVTIMVNIFILFYKIFYFFYVYSFIHSYIHTKLSDTFLDQDKFAFTENFQQAQEIWW